MVAPVPSTVWTFQAAGVSLGCKTSQDGEPEVLTLSSHGASGRQQPAVRDSMDAARRVCAPESEPVRCAGRSSQAAGACLGRETSQDGGAEVPSSSSLGASERQQPAVCSSERLWCTGPLPGGQRRPRVWQAATTRRASVRSRCGRGGGARVFRQSPARKRRPASCAAVVRGRARVVVRGRRARLSCAVGVAHGAHLKPPTRESWGFASDCERGPIHGVRC